MAGEFVSFLWGPGSAARYKEVELLTALSGALSPDVKKTSSCICRTTAGRDGEVRGGVRPPATSA